MPKVLSAHQPNFIPYLGFFDKMKNSDVFVVRDEVLFIDNDFHHRNKIRINSNDNINNPQSKWISVPVENKHDYILHTPIKKATMRSGKAWNVQLLHDIKANYQGMKFFNKYYPELEKIFDNSDEKLIDLNMKIIKFFMSVYNINTEIIMASSLGLKPANYTKTDPSEDLALICEKVGADVYLSGSGGKNYLNLEPFNKRGIKVIYQEYTHPIYEQKFPGFIPFMAAIDALFSTGNLPETTTTNDSSQNDQGQNTQNQTSSTSTSADSGNSSNENVVN